MPKYYQTENTGKGFITHEDNELAHIGGYPGNIWVTENTEWDRHGLVEMTKTTTSNHSQHSNQWFSR